ncbi:unnamed protein product [Triticum turgidum subsp. durum]|uniref:Valine--tRNA ligase, mitochondrial n=1 Tax=Triticum turgidum subsp. durum TaxID=4567 RepID=A0A9R0Q538_TRITD|nr:unnamed protein product [Triticum turgidum subsp. durum]
MHMKLDYQVSTPKNLASKPVLLLKTAWFLVAAARAGCRGGYCGGRELAPEGPIRAMEEPLDEKDLERKLKKEQKVLVLIWFCAVHDGVGEHTSRLAKSKEEKKLKAKQKEEARLQVATGGTNPFLGLEERWYPWWESSQYFVADAASSKPPFVIVLPPPNVTGALHIGHAITVAIEVDAMIRWRRMSGYNALWIPGMDHAGIATQLHNWKDQYGGTIQRQLRTLGASLDWSRECFTMDEQRSGAVTETFVRLYKEGLIYRDIRLVNWDCTLRTAISDIEVDRVDLKAETFLEVPGYSNPVQFGVLTSFAYPLEEGLGEIIVATTRIETMLGDTAIAVHSQDERYKHLHGKYAVHPFNGRKLEIICADDLVKATFGTGAVKITPAHDSKDFEVGKQHNLDFINIFTDDGNINENGGPQFEGMPRFTARAAVIDALKEKGLYRGMENNEMELGRCSRTNDIVEPMIKPQWFVNCNTMAKAALDAVKSKEIEIIPPQYEQDWYRWLENIRDWCISRQLWWGHRVPAWYVTLEDDKEKGMGSYIDHWIIARNKSDAVLEAEQRYPEKKYQLDQDPDVLDTWFSAGLFPLTVLGWPDNTADLSTFYPTSVLETGLDILFFWVARMVMMGMLLHGDVPFRKIYLHPIIRDAHGRKMSKSLGNVIDPIDVINGITLEGLQKKLEQGNLDQGELEKAKEGQKKDFPDGIPECGTDALRFALISYTSQSDKINLDIKRVHGYRQWCNKLWNAIRFAMIKLGDQYTPPATLAVHTMLPICKWILSVLSKAVGKTVSSLEAYKFSDATSSIYFWWQYQLCDVFIEAIKPYFNGSEEFESARGASRDTLWACLDTGLRLLHPFMPYITEELWQRLPQPKEACRKDSIMISEYPSAVQEWANDKVENEMEIVLDAVSKLRSLRPPTDIQLRRPSFVLCRNLEIAATVRCYQAQIATLASVSSLKALKNPFGRKLKMYVPQVTIYSDDICLALAVCSEDDPTPPDCATNIVNKDLALYLQFRGALDTEAEHEKLRKKREEVQKQYDTLSQKMSASGYREKAPQSKQDDDMKKLATLLEELEIISEAE